jgi:hypothetical protein
MTDPQACESITAHMTIWRVFGLIDKFEDRPQPYWSESAQGIKADSDRLTVMVGELPSALPTALRQWRAQRDGALAVLTGQQLTYEQLLSSYQNNLSTEAIPEFDESYTAWLTLQLDRSLEVEANPTEIRWLANPDPVIQELRSFADEGSDFLDVTTARVLGAATKLHVRRLRFNERRPYLTAPGKAAIAISNVEAKVNDWGIVIGRAGGWASASSERISSSINQGPVARADYKLFGQATSWLCAAMAEEDDHLRRFTFAYGGLELLVTQAEKENREGLIAKIEQVDSNLPVRELLWPGTNEDFALRNLVFRFAVLAALYSPETAAEDVQKFRIVAKSRNEFYHGSEQLITLELARDCEELLHKYVGLVAFRESSN